MAFFQNGNAKIFYEVEGEGTPVFLLAPGGMRSANALWGNMPWNPRDSLLDDYELIGMDQRNAGGSKAPICSTDSWSDYTSDQVALLDHLGIGKCHLVGMCIGGPFIAGLLKTAPERFLSAVMLQPVGIDGNQEAFFDMFDAWADDLSSSPDRQTLEKFRRNMWDGEFLLTATQKEVGLFNLPILVLMGDDLYHPQTTSRQICDLAPNATLVEEWKNPDVLQRTDSTIRSFLAEHS